MESDTNVKYRQWAIAAAVSASAMVVIYLTLIVAEGGNSFGAVAPWAVLMGLGALATFAAALTPDPKVARRIIYGAIAFFAVLGLVSILSIGIGFLFIVALLVIAASRLP